MEKGWRVETNREWQELGRAFFMQRRCKRHANERFAWCCRTASSLQREQQPLKLRHICMTGRVAIIFIVSGRFTDWDLCENFPLTVQLSTWEKRGGSCDFYMLVFSWLISMYCTKHRWSCCCLHLSECKQEASLLRHFKRFWSYIWRKFDK